MPISDWSSDVCSSDLVAHPAAGLAAQQLADQALADAAAASLRMYCDLPHEEGIRLLRRQIAGDPSDRPAVDLGEGAGAGEVRALQQVAVEGVVVQRRDAADQGPDACAISLVRRSVVDGGAARKSVV